MYYSFLFGVKLFGEKILNVTLKGNAKRHREPQHTAKRRNLNLSKPHNLNCDCAKTYAILQTYDLLHNLFEHICFFLAQREVQFVQTGWRNYFPARSDMNGLAVVCGAHYAWWSRETDGAELSVELETVSRSRLKCLSLFWILLSTTEQFILIYRLRITLKIKKKYPEFLSELRERLRNRGTLNWIQHVNFTVHSADREEVAGLEEGRAERTGGEMVRKGRQESGEEAEEDGTAGRAGESHHNSECQHQVYHHTTVSAFINILDSESPACGEVGCFTVVILAELVHIVLKWS